MAEGVVLGGVACVGIHEQISPAGREEGCILSRKRERGFGPGGRNWGDHEGFFRQEDKSLSEGRRRASTPTRVP